MSTLVFPIAFSINSAFSRRENSLQQLALLKASAASFHSHMLVYHASVHGIPENYAQVPPPPC